MRTKEEIRRLVHNQLDFHLREAMAGDELIFKEVWEELEPAEMTIATDCLTDIVVWLKKTSS